MSLHVRWADVPLAEIVDAVLVMAARHGEAEVFIKGPSIRVEAPGTFTAREYDDHCGSIRRGTPRNEVMARLLPALLLAVGE